LGKNLVFHIFSFSHSPLVKRAMVITWQFYSHLLLQPSNSARGFVDKTEARLAPGCVQLYSEAVNSSDVLLGVVEGTKEMESKAKPIIDNTKA
jgi:hypothetical protein